MELTWLADSPQSRSRTRALRACQNCQRRKVRVSGPACTLNAEILQKKRCRHLTPTSGLAASRFPAGDTEGPQAPRARARTASADAASPSFLSTERFVGDLNPEAFIRERLHEPTGNPLRDRIGLWISSPPSQDTNGHQSRRYATATDPLSALPSQPNLDGPAIASVLHQRYIFAVQACGRLPAITREPLTAIYFSKVNHIIPLIDKEAFLGASATESASVFLERALCLVAAKDRDASPHLRLAFDGPVLSARQFCSEIYKGLSAAIDANLETDRLACIRVLALMSLHCEGYEGAEAASLHLCQAIHQAQTIGLHLDRPGRTSADPLVKLFWCLWTLDKMHASIGGRPVLLADRDIGIEKPNKNIRGAFGVWMAISDLLATVISFYRPSAGTTGGWEEGFPAFEDIVGEDAHEVNFVTLGFLELFYHSVAILTYRSSLAGNLDSTRVSSIRQGLAAVRIHSIVSSECVDQLPPLPIVPYAIALSMGVSYRQLRSSKLITHFDRAKASLEANCSLLEDLGPHWYSAEAMARLGRKALQQIDHEHPRQSGPWASLTQPPANTAPLEPPAVEATSLNYPSTQSASDVDTTMPLATEEPEGTMSVGAFPSMPDLDGTTDPGFADIDMLFGEFLDLSLPTNFWDPIFAEQDATASPNT